MFTGPQIVALLTRLGITHVVTVPDSTVGPWGDAIATAPGLRLVRVCREGEAWAVAGGLWLSGQRPLVMIQCTGLFESGDALARNILHDWKIPVPSIIGYRSYLNPHFLPGDTCLVFTEPALDAWRIAYKLITSPDQYEELATHLETCLAAERPGAGLIAEGRA